MNRELRVLESGFRASAAALGNWADDASGLEMRIKSLSEQMDVQRRKVEATREEYERIKREKGENSKAAQDLEIKLNRETETLGKMENELGNTEGALQEMTDGTEDATDATEEMGEQAEETGSILDGLKPILAGVGVAVLGVVAAMAALGAAALGAISAIKDLVFNAAEAAGELVDISTKTGISTTRLQELDFIANQVGTSLDTITGSQAKLIRSMDTAGQQSQDYAQKLSEAQKAGKDIGDIELGDAAAAFRTLGVEVTDGSGQLRDSQAVFSEVIDKLGSVGNETERDALAMQIFGKSAQELNPLIKTGSAGMAALAQQAHEVGAVMSEEDVAGLEAFGDTMAALQDGLKGVLGTLAADFLPVFQTVFDQVGGYLKIFSDIVKNSNGDFGKMAEGLTGLITQIAQDLAKQAPQFLQAGLNIVMSILDAIIASLPELLNAGTQIITALINFLVQALPQLLQMGVQILLTLINAIVENLPMIVEAALQAIIALANGLAEALPVLIPAIVQAIITIVQVLTENLPMLIQAAMMLIQGLADGLIQALPILIAALPALISGILNTLIASLPMFFEMAGKLVTTLAAGILDSAVVLVVAVGDLIVRLGDTFAQFIRTLPAIGKSFVKGLADGISNAAGLLYDAVKNMINNMIQNMKDLLGIHSPSTVGAEMGSNLANSFGSAFLKDLDRVKGQMKLAMQDLTAPGSGLGVVVAGNTSVQNDLIQIFAPVSFQGETTAQSLGARIKGRRY